MNYKGTRIGNSFISQGTEDGKDTLDTRFRLGNSVIIIDIDSYGNV